MDEWIKKLWYTHTDMYTHIGILFTHKKEWNHAICDNIDGPWGRYVKWEKSEKDRKQAYKHRNRLVVVTGEG